MVADARPGQRVTIHRLLRAANSVVFASGDPDYDLVEMSLDGKPTRPLLATARNESDPAWSPDGNLFAYVTDRSGQDEIWLRTREGRWVDRPLVTQRDFGDDRTIMLSSPSFSPDGQRIAYQRNAQKPIWPLRIWISSTGRRAAGAAAAAHARGLSGRAELVA